MAGDAAFSLPGALLLLSPPITLKCVPGRLVAGELYPVTLMTPMNSPGSPANILTGMPNTAVSASSELTSAGLQGPPSATSLSKAGWLNA
jgi:hypothetical protein